MNVEAIEKYAEKMLQYSVKTNTFDKYVIGIPYSGVRVKNTEGQEEECIFAKMEAIYKYYRENPDSSIDKKLNSVLLKYAPIVKSMEGIIVLLRTIEYQIVAEKEKRAPFSLDNSQLLKELQTNLNNNKELYQSEIYEKARFWETIENYNQSLSSNYGHKIL